jgi:hypothetical protein
MNRYKQWQAQAWPAQTEDQPLWVGSDGDEHLSLHGLKPGTAEYTRVEALLIKRLCDIDLGDETRFDDDSEVA